MSPRQALRFLHDRLLGTAFDRAVARAHRTGSHRFLLGWNRGLGDVGLGLTPFLERLRREFADARLEAITRADLEPVFRLAGADAVHVVPGLARGQPLDVPTRAKALGLDLAAFGAVLAQPDPRRWSRTVPDDIAPRLHWDGRHDALAARFEEVAPGVPWVVVHAHSGTSGFYRYTKDWPAERWPQLFAHVRERLPARFLLVGEAGGPAIAGDGVVDLRGRATLLEVLALTGERASAVVAPDSGILSILYLLDWQRDLDIVSLWADPRQGVLKLGHPSPNTRLRHYPLLGREERVANVTVEQVAGALLACLERPRAHPAPSRASPIEVARA